MADSRSWPIDRFVALDGQILGFAILLRSSCLLTNRKNHMPLPDGYTPNGPEYISQILADRAAEQSVLLEFIQPNNPQQNAYVERNNRTVRYDWLTHHLFESIEEVQERSTNWLWSYNNERLNMAIGGIAPKQRLAMVA